MKMRLLIPSLAAALSLLPASALPVGPSSAAFAQKEDDKKDDKKSDEEKKKDDEDDKKKDKDDDDDEMSKEEIVQIDDLIGTDAIFQWTPEKLEEGYKKKGFKWLSETNKDRGILRPGVFLKTSERNNGKSVYFSAQKQRLQFMSGRFGAEEAGFEFKDGKLSMVTISVWNKGDADDDINEVAFRKQIADLTTALTERLKTRAQELGKDAKSASKAIRTRWETPTMLVQLEQSSDKDRQTGFQAEFIRLRLAPKTKTALGSTANANAAKYTQADLVKNVAKEANGDVYIKNVPMVDQGDKGYCALASTERVMRYYGIECDQHDMAKVTGADAYGTDPEDLQTALHKLQQPFKIRVRDIIHWDIKDYEKFTDVYNREAKKIGAKLCPEGYIWISFRSLDKNALREARSRNNNYERFRKSVTDFVGRGVPLLWGLELGIFAENGEKNPQAFGGHMRLIIGFNAKTDEIIFSDSWGAGHEIKRMAWKDAFAVTKGLYMVEPQAR